ncbi:hypothetical protein ACT2CI_00595 [Candidatus Vidania fulgoroideorum]
MNLHVFDLDKTILKIDCEKSFLYFLYKNKEIKKKEIKICEKFYNDYKNCCLNFKKYQKFYTKIIKKKKKKINFFLKFLKKKIFYKSYLIMKKKKKKIISSSSNKIICEKICEKILKEDFIKSNKNFRRNKLYNIMKYLYKYNSKKLIFYTDSNNDISMVNFSSKSIIINSDNLLIKKFYNKKLRFIFIKRILKI